MGAGGRGSGGGGSTTDYPEYQKVIQADWLGGGEYDDPTTMARLDSGNSITALINQAINTGNPYSEALAYDPSTQVSQLLNGVLEYLPRLDREVDAYLTYVEQHITALENDTSLEDADTDIAALDLTTYVSNYESDGALVNLGLIADDFEDGVNPDIYYVEGALDYALGYVDGMDTTEEVEAELGQFNSNMREINAVHSSAFAIGNQIVASGLLGTKAKLHTEIGKYKSDKMLQYVQLKVDIQARLADLKLKIQQLQDEKARAIMSGYIESAKAKLGPIVNLAQLKLDKSKTVAELEYKAHSQVYTTIADGAKSRAHLMIEARRMALIAYKEEAEENLRIDTKDAMWSIEIFQGAANVMASIAGGTVTTTEEPTSSRGALGGALSGAASGAMIGAQTSTPHGALIGGAIGGVGGLLMGM
jgi:hypothetical protein